MQLYWFNAPLNTVCAFSNTDSVRPYNADISHTFHGNGTMLVNVETWSLMSILSIGQAFNVRVLHY